MFPKLNMTGDTKAMRNGIIAKKPLLRHTITKETTETSTRLELYSFMRRNAYLRRATKFRTNKRFRRRWCHGIQDRWVMC